MAIEYFCCYHSYLDLVEPLNDTERGRLFMACLMYSKTGEAPELRGNERFIFPAFKSQIDRDGASYAEKCKRQAENAKKRWDATACDGMPRDATACQPMPTDAKYAKEKEKEKEKTKEKAKEKEYTHTAAQIEAEEAELGRLPSGFRPLMQDWLEYKRQRKEKYTPAGLTALVSEVLNNLGKYGDVAVREIVRTSMANGYKGIVFDRLKTAAPARLPGNNPTSYTTDFAKAAVARMMQEDGQ